MTTCRWSDGYDRPLLPQNPQYHRLKDSLLASEEWCELVFENRNRRYGAYVLRRDAGRRYRRVAEICGGIFLACAVLLGVTGYFFYRALQNTLSEVEEVVKLKQLKDVEVKNVSVGRRAVAHAKPDAVSDVPEVADEAVTNSGEIGIKGPDDGDFVEESGLKDHDPNHHDLDESLPIEGAHLTKTDIVDGMPFFPGGLQALMRFMDEHCEYSDAAIRKKLEGDCEVAFIIDEEGNVIEPEIIKHLHPVLDRAVLEAVKAMPKWKPGIYQGRPTPVRMSIPVHFQIK